MQGNVVRSDLAPSRLLLVLTKVGGTNAESPLSVEIEASGATLGRSADCTFQLPSPDRTLPRVCARLVFDHGTWFLVNLTDKVEVSVNGQVASLDVPLALSGNDVIHIGDVGLEARTQLARVALSPATDAFAPAAAELSRWRIDRASPPADSVDTSDFLDANPLPSASPGGGYPPAAYSHIPAAASPPGDLPSEAAPQIAGRQPSFLPGRSETPSSALGPEEVSLGAAAPRECERGTWFIAHLVAYPPSQRSIARDLLDGRQRPDMVKLLDLRTCRWAKGTNVTVTLHAEGFEVSQPTQVFTWDAKVQMLDYRLRATEAAAPLSVIEFAVSIAGFAVATVCLDVRVGNHTSQESVEARQTAARTAFASYASADRALVMHLVGAIERAAGIDLFVDCLQLRANSAWKEDLAREINVCQLFLLFWSQSASASQWVEWEWQSVLRTKGERAIQFHPLEPDVPPPPPLRHLHAGSVHALVAAYYSRPWWRKIWNAITSTARDLAKRVPAS